MQSSDASRRENVDARVQSIIIAKGEAAECKRCRGDAKHRTRKLEIPGLVLTHHPGMTEPLDCFAEPVIGRRFARPRWLAMTVLN